MKRYKNFLDSSWSLYLAIENVLSLFINLGLWIIIQSKKLLCTFFAYVILGNPRMYREILKWPFSPILREIRNCEEMRYTSLLTCISRVLNIIGSYGELWDKSCDIPIPWEIGKVIMSQYVICPVFFLPPARRKYLIYRVTYWLNCLPTTMEFEVLLLVDKEEGVYFGDSASIPPSKNLENRCNDF